MKDSKVDYPEKELVESYNLRKKEYEQLGETQHCEYKKICEWLDKYNNKQKEI